MLTHQWCAVSPAEVIFYCLVIEANPLVVLCIRCAFAEKNTLIRTLFFLIFFLCPHLHGNKTAALTVDKVLLLRGDDADQVGVQVSAAALCIQPCLSLGEVQVAVALKLSPAVFTLLLVCSHNSQEATLLKRSVYNVQQSEHTLSHTLPFQTPKLYVIPYSQIWFHLMIRSFFLFTLILSVEYDRVGADTVLDTVHNPCSLSVLCIQCLFVSQAGT